jgi:hypothetical protein
VSIDFTKKASLANVKWNHLFWHREDMRLGEVIAAAVYGKCSDVGKFLDEVSDTDLLNLIAEALKGMKAPYDL